MIYFRLGELDKAVQDFTRSVELYPTQGPSLVASYFHLGRALAKLGQKDEAIRNLRQSLELNTKIGSLSILDAAELKRLIEELSQGS